MVGKTGKRSNMKKVFELIHKHCPEHALSETYRYTTSKKEIQVDFRIKDALDEKLTKNSKGEIVVIVNGDKSKTFTDLSNAINYHNEDKSKKIRVEYKRLVNTRTKFTFSKYKEIAMEREKQSNPDDQSTPKRSTEKKKDKQPSQKQSHENRKKKLPERSAKNLPTLVKQSTIEEGRKKSAGKPPSRQSRAMYGSQREFQGMIGVLGPMKELLDTIYEKCIEVRDMAEFGNADDCFMEDAVGYQMGEAACIDEMDDEDSYEEYDDVDDSDDDDGFVVGDDEIDEDYGDDDDEEYDKEEYDEEEYDEDEAEESNDDEEEEEKVKTSSVKKRKRFHNESPVDKKKQKQVVTKDTSKMKKKVQLKPAPRPGKKKKTLKKLGDEPTFESNAKDEKKKSESVENVKKAEEHREKESDKEEEKEDKVEDKSEEENSELDDVDNEGFTGLGFDL